MAKTSLADKLKIIFSPEKGKEVLNYTYENIIKPNLKQTAFLAAQTFLAKQMGIDERNIPKIGTTYTSYSAVSKGIKHEVDVKSYLPDNTAKKQDITSIGFKNQIDAKNLLDFMQDCIDGPMKKCRLSDVYEYLNWSISSSDMDLGWRSMMGIGLLNRDGLTYISAPAPERI